MSTLFLTIALACAFVLGAMALLGISWLITGKSSLKPGACGRDPTKKRDDKACGKTCHLCEMPDEKEKTDLKSTDEHDD